LCSAEAVRGENCGDRREAGPEEERGARVVLQPAAEAEAHEVCCAALTARRRRRVGCCGGGQWPLQPPPPPGPLPTDVGRDGGGRRRGRLRAASAKLKHLLCIWIKTRADTHECSTDKSRHTQLRKRVRCLTLPPSTSGDFKKKIFKTKQSWYN